MGIGVNIVKKLHTALSSKNRPRTVSVSAPVPPHHKNVPPPRPPQHMGSSPLEKNTQEQFEKPLVPTKKMESKASFTLPKRAPAPTPKPISRPKPAPRPAMHHKKHVHPHKPKKHPHARVIEKIAAELEKQIAPPVEEIAPPIKAPSPFFLCDGRTVHDVMHLKDIAQSMSYDTYSHHVTPMRNDFADWVEGVFSDFALATRLRKASSLEEFRAAFSPEKPAPVKPAPAPRAKPVDVHSEHINEADLDSRIRQKKDELHRIQESINAQKAQLEETQRRLDALQKDLRAANMHSEVTVTVFSESNGAVTVDTLRHAINSCREMIKNKHLDAAQTAYHNLREDFQKAKLSDDERHEIYSHIHELYTDLHLAKINASGSQ